MAESGQPAEATAPVEAEQVVTPWEVSSSGVIDYDKLIDTFGCQKLTDAMVARVERLTQRPAHPFLKRGIFFAHRWTAHRLWQR